MNNDVMSFWEFMICMMIVLVLGMLIGAGIVAAETANDRARLYPRTAVVVEIDRPNDTVVCEDSVGMLWAFYGADDWELDDCVSLLMDSRGTDSIYDDSIVAARYSAWVLQ